MLTILWLHRVRVCLRVPQSARACNHPCDWGLKFGGEDATLESRVVTKLRTDGWGASEIGPRIFRILCGHDAVQTAAERCESALSLKFCIASFVIGSGENKDV
jgi:hypothetical protein